MSLTTKVAQIVAIGLLALSTSVFSANESMVFKKEGNEIRITLDECTTKAGVFATMPETLRPQFKAATILWDNKTYEACWMQTSVGEILLVDETGDQGSVPLSLFTRESK